MADIDHVAVCWDDLDAGIATLSHVFGMRLVRVGKHARTGAPIALVADRASGFKLEIIGAAERGGEASVSSAGPRFEHVAFRVPDVEAGYRELTGSGWTGIAAPHELAAARASTALLRGPGGLAVQIVHYETGSPDL